MDFKAITEALAEQIIDTRVTARLVRDKAYNNAADAEAQAAREQEIAEEEWKYVTSRYTIIDTVTSY